MAKRPGGAQIARRTFRQFVNSVVSIAVAVAVVGVLVYFTVVREGRSVTTELPLLGTWTIGARPQELKNPEPNNSVSLQKYQTALDEVKRLEGENNRLHEEVKALQVARTQPATNFLYAYSTIDAKMMCGLVINTTVPVKDGDIRDVYACVQYLLAILGCHEGEIDGGQETTHAAVIKFQAANRLSRIDGIIGHETWTSMLGELEKQGAPTILQQKH
ncbi:MAG: peptidoglycan-binding domain-containing protein [Phycisphaerales bacterium]